VVEVSGGVVPSCRKFAVSVISPPFIVIATMRDWDSESPDQPSNVYPDFASAVTVTVVNVAYRFIPDGDALPPSGGFTLTLKTLVLFKAISPWQN
jgi:hypothetical protein